MRLSRNTCESADTPLAYNQCASRVTLALQPMARTPQGLIDSDRGRAAGLISERNDKRHSIARGRVVGDFHVKLPKPDEARRQSAESDLRGDATDRHCGIDCGEVKLAGRGKTLTASVNNSLVTASFNCRPCPFA